MSKSIDFGFDGDETWEEFFKRLTSHSRPDLSDGRPVIYSDAVRNQHHNHVHAAVYDKGGWLQPGLTMAHNKTGVPERVLGADECIISGGDLRAGRWVCSRPGHPTATSDCAVKSQD